MDELKKSIEAHNLAQRLQVESLGQGEQLMKSIAAIGEIREWSGKKYKKQANGKWLEVSKEGQTKKEHEENGNLRNKWATEVWEKNKYLSSIHEKRQKEHEEAASKLSDKEHSDEEVGLGGKIIGHTKSKKPIYEKASHSSHRSFDKEDHMDAQRLHRKIQKQNSDRRDEEGYKTVENPYQKDISYHGEQMMLHQEEASKKGSYGTGKSKLNK